MISQQTIMRPTPETDAHINENHRVYGNAMVTRDHARNLERQRDEAREEIARIRADDDRNNQLMVELMKQRDELLEALKLTVSRMKWLSDQVKNDGNQTDWILGSLKQAEAAIANVKGTNK
jgi:hypothetical protein